MLGESCSTPSRSVLQAERLLPLLVSSSTTSAEGWKQEVKPQLAKGEQELQSMHIPKREKIKIDSQRKTVLRHVLPVPLHTFLCSEQLDGIQESTDTE